MRYNFEDISFSVVFLVTIYWIPLEVKDKKAMKYLMGLFGASREKNIEEFSKTRRLLLNM